eukprot:CAMPEP_0174737594 /NCGR_PEP_ID=MMETSP1094-20130205/68559_1 /TAXON_ID=156173 /ORGANISM="Chrysochromulina brevifilum, Strain UTEX LB 985" /LENGTH=88 /DNA_ID=CAMNT_0015940847 /DNA_START=82 /DNA_END=348 /DNA_ORIENTATION=+
MPFGHAHVFFLPAISPNNYLRSGRQRAWVHLPVWLQWTQQHAAYRITSTSSAGFLAGIATATARAGAMMTLRRLHIWQQQKLTPEQKK